MTKAIYFQNVSYAVDDTPILTDITGSFPDGKITTLVGPSGSGKTTVLKLCNGLVSPTSGDIYIDGRPIASYEPTALRRHIGIALQYAPFIDGTVYDNLALPYRLRGQSFPEQNAIEYLEKVGLDKSLLYRDGNELSGGQRQKVSIARTLINHPKVLLLDEITSALDPTSVREIEELIMNINKTYCVTIVWITHDISQAMKIGEYTWVLKEGQLVEEGEIEILQRPTNEFIRRFVQGEVR